MNSGRILGPLLMWDTCSGQMVDWLHAIPMHTSQEKRRAVYERLYCILYFYLLYPYSLQQRMSLHTQH